MSFGERWPGGELVTVVPQGAAVAQLKLAK
jgi:hypothetical protein